MKLKELQEVVARLPINKRVKPDILGQKQDQVELLYQLLKKGSTQSEEDAIRQLLPHSKTPRRSLWKLKDKLIERIGNSLITFPNNIKMDIFEKKNFEGYYYFLILRLAISTGINSFIESIGRKTLKIAKEFHITELGLLTSNYLRRYYLVQDFNIKNFNLSNEIYLEYLNRYETEIEIENLQLDLILSIKQKISYEPHTRKKIQEIYEKVDSISKNNFSYKALINSMLIKTTCLHLNMDYDKATELIAHFEKELEGFSFTPFRKHLFSFELKKIPGYIVKKKFLDADRSIKSCLEITSNKSYNFFITKQMQTLSLFHQGRYEEAHQITVEIINIPNANSETWEIYHAYACILTGRHFRCARFLNQVPFFSKDKKGMNINIVIIPVLDFLRKKIYYKVIDRADALKRYIYRHLLADESTYRSRQFLEILICLANSSFQLEKLECLALPYLKALDKVPLHEARQDYELEVVPYELLWNWIKQCLQ